MTKIGRPESAAIPDSAAIHFSTHRLPPAQRLPALRDLFDRSVQLEIDAAPGHAVEMSMALVPGVRRARMLSSLTARMNRPTPMLADGEDTVCLMMKTCGHLAVRQGRREGVPQVGDGVLLVYREPASPQFVTATYLSVRVPFSALALANNVSAAAARCIPRDTEALSLLRAYVANMPDRVADPQLVRLYATHVYDLISLAIGASDEGRQIANQRGVRAARREAIKAHLIRNPGVTLDQLAAQQGISPRYVQMLFEEVGTTFSEFALERRLDAVRGMLTSPRYATWSVTAIALDPISAACRSRALTNVRSAERRPPSFVGNGHRVVAVDGLLAARVGGRKFLQPGGVSDRRIRWEFLHRNRQPPSDADTCCVAVSCPRLTPPLTRGSFRPSDSPSVDKKRAPREENGESFRGRWCSRS